MSDHDHHHHNHHGEMHPHQLEPPHEVFHDPKAGEVARAWITNGGLSLSLHAMAFGKPEIWGHVLAGMASKWRPPAPRWATEMRPTISRPSARR